MLARVRALPAYQSAREQVFGTVSAAGDVAKARAGRMVDRVLPSEPEPSYEPGLEFNPDFTPTADEILADLRGDAPSA